jgi:ABC-type uncharacterized transport system permease subunit
VITTIMLNWIASGSARTCSASAGRCRTTTRTRTCRSRTTSSPRRAKLPVFWGDPELQGLHIGFFVALAALVVYWVILNRTTLGYEVRAVGFNPEAARYGGINVARNYFLAMAISGAFAGLAGAIDILGWQYRIGTNDIQVSNIGFIGIAVALLGRNTALGVGARALLFGALVNGTSTRHLDPEIFPPSSRQPDDDHPGRSSCSSSAPTCSSSTSGTAARGEPAQAAPRRAAEASPAPTRGRDARGGWRHRCSALLAFWVALPPIEGAHAVVPVVIGARSAIALGHLGARARRAAARLGRDRRGAARDRARLLATRSGARRTSTGRRLVGALTRDARYATPLVFAAIGGIFSERSGVVNIGLEGMMLMGAFFGASARTSSELVGRSGLIAAVAGGRFALVHAFFAIHLRADQIVSGTAINFLALGVTGYFFIDIYGDEGRRANIPRSRRPPRFLEDWYFGGPRSASST